MDPAYSRIIIVDHVLPDVQASLLQSSMGIQMMSIGAGVGRSEGQWKELLGSVGFPIQGILTSNPEMVSVIEVVAAKAGTAG